jgi:hypothetical protein
VERVHTIPVCPHTNVGLLRPVIECLNDSVLVTNLNHITPVTGQQGNITQGIPC